MPTRTPPTHCVPSMPALTSSPTSVAPVTVRTRSSRGARAPSGSVMTTLRAKFVGSSPAPGTTFTWVHQAGWIARGPTTSVIGKSVTASTPAAYVAATTTVSARAGVRARR